MDENTSESAPESPRFGLLPHGCKDLGQAIRMHGPLRYTRPASPTIAFALSKYPQGWPATVALPDPVPVSELADAINLPVSEVIRVFMQFHLYVTPTHLIEFTTAKSLCSLCGVEAFRADAGAK